MTIALDDETLDLVKTLREEINVSQSELLRKAIKFYKSYRSYFENGKVEKIKFYMEMLNGGDHIILDVDHYLSILKFIENSPEKEQFWKNHKEIGRSHADQFHDTYKNFEDVFKRLEACNFFKIIKESSNYYTVLLGSELPKTFIKLLLEEILTGMGFKIEIKEDFAKLRIIIKNLVM